MSWPSNSFDPATHQFVPLRQPRRRKAVMKLASAVGIGLEKLETRALFNGAVANPGGPYTVNEGSSITLDASGSTDNTGTILTYKWDLNYNGSFVANVSTAAPLLNYTAGPAKPQRTLALEVVATDGTSSIATTTLNINDVPPTINLTGGGSVNRGVSTPISWTYTDPGNEPVTNWLVNWGDGTTQTLAGSANSSSHVYSADGNFTITLTSEQTVLGNQVTVPVTAGVTVTPVQPVITLTGDAHVNELAPYTLDISATDPSGLDSWVVDWGDGSSSDVLPGSATSDTHTYATHGDYTVSATAIDNAGDSSTSTQSVVADDVPPAPTIAGTPGSSINEGDTISLTATPNDPGSASSSYAWSVTRNGQPFTLPNGTVTNTASLSFVAGYAGNYVATVAVTDDAGETGTASTSSITANAVAPTVTISGANSPVNKGDTISLTANPSDPGTNDTYSYAWSVTRNGQPYSLPDNVSTTGQQLSFIAGRSGTFVATVVVTDRDHGTGHASTGAIVSNNVNPTAVIAGQPSGNSNEGTSLDLTATPSDTGLNESFTYAWTLTKNGNPVSIPGPVPVNQASFVYTPEDAGTYVATVSVTDSDNGTGSANSGSIAVVNVPPTITIGGTPSGSTNEGTAINLTATPSEPSNDRTYSYSWSVTQDGDPFTLPNGVSTTDSSFSFTPPTEGTYVATVQVTDDEGGQSSQSTGNMTVANVPPSATIAGTPGVPIAEGTAVSLTATGSEPGSGHNFSYSWSVTHNGSPYTLPQGTVTNAATLAWTPNQKGHYVATVTTTDEEDNAGTNTTGFWVHKVSPTVAITNQPANPINEGTEVSLGSTESEPGLGIYTYSWSVTLNGNAFTLPEDVATNTSSLDFTPVAAGTYVATLTVTDSEGGQTTTTGNSIVVDAVAPTASITGVPQTAVNEFSPLTLGVTASDINPANTRTYLWSVTKNGQAYDLPQVINTTSTSFTFTPDDAGTYVVSCQVTNSEEQSTTASSGNITVNAIPPVATIDLSEGTRQEGTAIDASAAVTDVGSSDSASYAWSVTRDGQAYTLPQGTDTTDQAFTFTPQDQGVYQIQLVATDTGGEDTVTTDEINVADVAPTITISGVPVGNASEGSTINLTANITQVGVNDSVASYAWTVTKNGQPFDLSGITTNNSSLSFTPLDKGHYVATVTVTNASDASIDGASTQQSTGTINVVNVPPSVSISGTSGTVQNGATLSFSATASEPGNHPLAYDWTVTRNGQNFTLPTGTIVNTSALSFAPGRAGQYIATCMVIDTEAGVTSNSSGQVTVTDVAPTVSVSGEPQNSINAGTAVSLTATASDPGQAETLTYAWSVTRNGNPYTLPGPVATNASTLNFTPDRVGTYVATVTVTDSDNGQTTVSSQNIGVLDVAPTVTVTAPASTSEGQTLNFSASATNPTAGDTFTYSWAVTRNGQAFTLPNGTVTNGTTLSFVAPTGGTYAATASVTDSAGSNGSNSASVAVSYLAPTVAITGAPTHGISAGSAVSLAAAAQEAGSGHAFTYAWSVTRNGSAYTLPQGTATNLSTFNFSPGRAGTYVATVVATDENNQTATANTVSIHVGDVAPAVGISGAPLASIPEATAISLTASPTSPGADETFSYQWSVTRNGSAYTLPNTVNTTSSELDFTPGLAGTFVASVTVTDSDGGVTTVATPAMVVSANAINVSVSGAPGSAINAGTAVNLSASASAGGADEQYAYTWSVTLNGNAYTLPDTVATNQSSLSFTTTDAGLYVATCVVTDTSGQNGSGNGGNITVNAVAPTVSITGAPSSSPSEGSLISLTAVPSDADTADTYSYEWTVTENGNPYTLPQGTITNAAGFAFRPNDVGNFVASVQVTDKANLTGSSTTSFSTTDVAPTVSIAGAPSTSPVGTALSFTGSTTSIGSSDSITGYGWSVTRNGSAYTPPGHPSTTGSSFSFTPDRPGIYIATLTATDNYGQSNNASTSSIDIEPVAPIVGITGTTGQVNEGDAINLTASAADPDAADTYSYAWSVTLNGSALTLPNTVTTNAAALSFTAPQPGSYVASVTVTDESNLQTTQHSSTITAVAVAPTAQVTGAPQTAVAEGTSVTLGTTVTSPRATNNYTYAWSATNNGHAYPLTGVTTNASTLSFAAAKPGTFVVTCVITDADGQIAAPSTSFTTTAVAPTLTISGNPSSSISEGTAVSLLASTSSPRINDTYGYAWSVTRNGSTYTLPDTVATNAAAFNFTPTQPGTFVASCTVTDADSQTATLTETFTVTDVAPTVSIGGAPSSSPVGTAIALTSSITSINPSNTISTYAWSITKDGSAFTPPGNPSTTGAGFGFTPDGPGTYVVSLSATDGYGQTGNGSTSSITVTSVAPTVSITGTSGQVNDGEAISLTAAATDPTTGDTYSYAWSVTLNGSAITLPNTVTTNAASLAFTAPQPGNYVASVTVTDAADLQTTQHSSTITAIAVAPTVVITGTPQTSVAEGTAVPLGTTVTSPRATNSYTYAWSVTNNGEAYPLSGVTTNASTFSFTPGEPGSYVVTCSVTDADGQVTVQAASLTAIAVAPTLSISGTPDSSISEGTAVSLLASASSPRIDDTYSYAWSVTLNSNAYTLPNTVATNAAALNFTPSQPGTFVATCTVTDADGQTATLPETITVTDVAPTVSITGAPSSTNVGTPISLTGGTTSIGSTDTISSYAWTVTKDGSPYTPVGNPSTTGSSFSFTPDGPGTYAASLAATNNYGNIGSASTGSITVSSVAPTVSITGTSGQVNEGDTIALTAAATDPTTGDTYSYAWSVKRNGTVLTLPNTVATNTSALSFIAPQPGSYVASVTVTDAANLQTTQQSSSITALAVAPTVSITGAPQTSVAEGTALTLGTTVTSPRSTNSYTYAWSVTDNGQAYPLTGITTNAASFNFTPGQPGNFVVSCAVTDLDGQVTTTPVSFTTTPVAPTLSITGAPSGSIGEGTIVSLQAAATSPRINDTYSYAWSVMRNGSPYALPNTAVTNAANFSFTPKQPGTFVATCTVTDADSQTASQPTTITVTSVAPTVVIAGAPSASIGEGTAIALTASATSPRSGDTFTYAWSVTKDGSPFTLPSTVVTNTAAFAYTPTVRGAYVATVTVTDLDNATNTATSHITVVNTPPTASITGLPQTINTGDPITLTAAATEPGSGNYSYAWTVTSNGNTIETGTASTLNITAGLAGAYHVSLAVTDGEGGVGTASTVYNVGDVAPNVSISGAPSTSPEGAALNLIGSATAPGTSFGESLTYAWTITRNGQPYPINNAAGSNLQFTPGIYGNYVATLTVTDSQGSSTAASATINVTSVAPTTALAAVPPSLRGTPITFNGTYSDPGSADTYTVTWNFGDGTTATYQGTDSNALTPTHTYAAAGNYPVTFTVTNSAAASGVSTQNVTIAAAMVGADPYSSGKTALFVEGTSGSDNIHVYASANNRIKVVVNGVNLGAFAASGHIIVDSLDGNDSVTIDSALTNSAVVTGGHGNDTFYGGGGNNVLIGGNGSNALHAGAGKDILVGGAGSDTLFGSTGSDMLIEGDAPFAHNATLLAEVDAQWTRTDESFGTIVHQLRGIAAGSLASAVSLNGTTLPDDNAADTLTAGTGRDWLFVGNNDTVKAYNASLDVETIYSVSPSIRHAKR
jgi:hypothetical protein